MNVPKNESIAQGLNLKQPQEVPEIKPKPFNFYWLFFLLPHYIFTISGKY
jgi:hypothetical protein